MRKIKIAKIIIFLLPGFFLLSPAFSDEPRLPQYITTHFKATSADEKIKGQREEGQFYPYEGKDADLRWMNLDKEGHPYNDSIMPAYNNYHNQITAYNAVKLLYDRKGNVINDRNGNRIPDEIEGFEHNIFMAGRLTPGDRGIHCDIINYSPLKKTGDADYLLENHPNMQILNNIIYGSSLFTVSFPPHWSPSNSYPVVLIGQGYGSDNNRMYKKPNAFAFYVCLQAKMYKMYQKGFIVVESNCGGREASGNNSNSLKDTGDFLVNVLSRYGADANRVITVGGSRAGNTALLWGVNPNQHAYNVLAIHAFVPPVKIGSMLNLSLSTYPSLAYVIDRILNATDAYSYSYKDLEAKPPKVLTTTEKLSALYRIILFDDNKQGADSKSAFGYFSRPDFINSLKKKRILISEGTHDAYMPLPYLIEFDNLLKKEGIPHTTLLGYCFGHSFDDASLDYLNTLQKLVLGKRITPFSGSYRRFYMPKELKYDRGHTRRGKAIRITEELIARIKSTRGYENYFNPAQDATKLGFSAAIPYLAVKGRPATVALVGEEGKSWKITCRKEDGYKNVYQKTGIFGASIKHSHELEYGKEYIILQFNADSDPGSYEWFFEYDGKEIPNRFTPFVDQNNVPVKAITIITDKEPSYADGYQYPLGDGAVNLGVDQYHPQLLIPNNPPVMRITGSIDKNTLSSMENIITLKAGQTLKLKLTATDLDKDKPVYDMLNAATGELLKGVNFNGLSGEFSYQARSKDKGTHRLKAIAKDGKGAIAEQILRLEIK